MARERPRASHNCRAAGRPGRCGGEVSSLWLSITGWRAKSSVRAFRATTACFGSKRGRRIPFGGQFVAQRLKVGGAVDARRARRDVDLDRGRRIEFLDGAGDAARAMAAADSGNAQGDHGVLLVL